MVSLPHRYPPGTLTAILRRVIEGAVTAWAAVTLTFFALRVVAGDPVQSLLARGLATPAQAENLRRSLGLDDPLLVQYGRFLIGIFNAEWGSSFETSQPVWTMVREQLGPTLRLGGTSLGIAVALGLVLGVLGAWRPGTPAGRLAPLLAGVATALPVATTGVLALLIYGLILRSTQGGEVATWLGRSALPAVVLGYAASGPIARIIQAGLEGARRAEYMLAARARGVAPELRLLWHALRPSLPPAVSLIALEGAFLFSGTVVTETVFARPGLGRLLVRSILQGDFPVAQALVALAALFYVGSQVLGDAIGLALDPRTSEHL